uniref:Ovule protein n=1 Tax=Heterorhabditis bacteriophora TaxID=37862 RepID=A0A1I7X4D2_HETBA
MSRQKVVKRDLKSCSRKHRSERHDSVRRSAFPLSSRIERSSISIIEDPLSSDDNKDVFPFAEKLKEYYHKSPVTKRLLPYK